MQTEALALQLIAHQQRPDGGFEIIGTNGIPAAPSPSADLTLHALLLDLLHERAAGSEVTTRLAHYLVRAVQMRELGSLLAVTDTRALFHALTALYEYDATLVPTDALVQAIRFLTAHEVVAGGPYLSAITKTGEPDLATNISIGRFVYNFGGPFPRLLDYIKTASRPVPDSPYFTVGWPMRLQLAKLYAAAGQSAAARQPEEKDLLIYIDPLPEPLSMYGMTVLAAARKLSAAPAPSLTVRRRAHKTTTGHMLKQAQTAAPYDPVIAKDVTAILTRVVRADQNQEIGLLASRFAPALRGNQPAPKTLDMLGVANLHNWAAYTAYDDLIDDDSSGAGLLPAANTSLRTSVRLFGTAVPSAAFRRVINATFDTVDAANAWELKHCRFIIRNGMITIGELPVYGQLENLYERSLTHSLPVLGTLAAAGIAPESDTAEMVLRAFKQYLIIRQLSDDLHDWREDLTAGHGSYVVTRTLEDAQISRGHWAPDALITRLERSFLHCTLPALGSDMLARAEEAHALLKQAADLNGPTVIDTLIDGIEQSTRRMLAEHERLSALLKAYRS
jgi:hypothetical protein